MESFHPECARRAEIFMEIRNTDKLAYLIYCERHTPLKLRRIIESKEKKYKVKKNSNLNFLIKFI